MLHCLNDRHAKKTLLQPCHIGHDQSLDERDKLLLMLREQVRNFAAEARRLGMCDQQFAVNNAIFVQLTFSANCLSDCQRQFRGNMQPLFGDVYDVTQGRRLAFRHKAPSGDRDPKMVTLIRHRYGPSC